MGYENEKLMKTYAGELERRWHHQDQAFQEKKKRPSAAVKILQASRVSPAVTNDFLFHFLTNQQTNQQWAVIQKLLPLDIFSNAGFLLIII